MTTNDLVLDNGLHSIIVTASPSFAPTLSVLDQLLFVRTKSFFNGFDRLINGIRVLEPFSVIILVNNKSGLLFRGRPILLILTFKANRGAK